jgi:hypothetical protein
MACNFDSMEMKRLFFLTMATANKDRWVFDTIDDDIVLHSICDKTQDLNLSRAKELLNPIVKTLKDLGLNPRVKQHKGKVQKNCVAFNLLLAKDEVPKLKAAQDKIKELVVNAV